MKSFLVIVIASGLFLTGCAGSSGGSSSLSSQPNGTIPTNGLKATQLHYLSGANQTMTVNMPVGNDLIFVLTTSSGQLVQGATFKVGAQQSTPSDSQGHARLKPILPQTEGNPVIMTATLDDGNGNILDSKNFNMNAIADRPVALTFIGDFSPGETHVTSPAGTDNGDYATLNWYATDIYGNKGIDPGVAAANLQVSFYSDSTCTTQVFPNIAFQDTQHDYTLQPFGGYNELYGFDTRSSGTYYLKLSLFSGVGSICSKAVKFQ